MTLEKPSKEDQILEGVRAMQNDQSRRNIENEAGEDPLEEVFTVREQEAIKRLVHEALVDFFKGYGITGKNFLLTTAIVLASIVGIGVSVKTMLAWIGISVMRN